MWVLAFEALAGMPAGPRVVTEGACESDHRTRTRPKTLVWAMTWDTKPPARVVIRLRLAGAAPTALATQGWSCQQWPSSAVASHRLECWVPTQCEGCWGVRVGRGESLGAWEWSVVRDARDNKSAA
jgi:hypothetical protein